MSSRTKPQDYFGRYPYRNAIEGRISTPEELKWIEKIDHYAEAPPKIAESVLEDVEAGRWTPLGESVSEGLKESALHIEVNLGAGPFK